MWFKRVWSMSPACVIQQRVSDGPGWHIFGRLHRTPCVSQQYRDCSRCKTMPGLVCAGSSWMMEVLMSLTGPQAWLQLWEPLGSILVPAVPQTIQQVISALNQVCEEISWEHARTCQECITGTWRPHYNACWIILWSKNFTLSFESSPQRVDDFRFQWLLLHHVVFNILHNVYH